MTQRRTKTVFTLEEIMYIYIFAITHMIKARKIKKFIIITVSYERISS
jgi:hypothetical protein